MAASQITAPTTPTPGTAPGGKPRKRSRLRRVFFRLVAMGCGLAVALLAVEIGLRIWGWAAPGYYHDGKGPLPIRTLNAEGGFGREFPGPGRHRSFEFDVPIYVNQHGFRERDLVPKAEGEWRIGLFGDSMTAGHGLLKDERFGEIWFDAVKDHLIDTTLWNFGSPAAGTWQSSTFVATGADAFELDEIVLALFAGNELQDNASWAQLRDLNSAELRQHDTTPRYSRLRTWLRHNSRFATFVWYNILSLAQANRAWYSDSGESLAERWPHTESALNAFKEAVGDRPFTIWYLPSHAEWDDAVWESIKEKQSFQDSDRFAVANRVKAWAEVNGASLIDCTPLFAGQSVEDLKFPIDPHWNAKGHKLVGTGLAATTLSSHRLRSPQN
ncbi:MAG: hypothetical protein ACYSTY_06070 [Planctomycetota bacterium]